MKIYKNYILDLLLFEKEPKKRETETFLHIEVDSVNDMTKQELHNGTTDVPLQTVVVDYKNSRMFVMEDVFLKVSQKIKPDCQIVQFEETELTIIERMR